MESDWEMMLAPKFLEGFRMPAGMKISVPLWKGQVPLLRNHRWT